VRHDQSARGTFSPRELEEAARELRTALSFDPCCSEAKLNLGIALLIGGSAGNIEQAITVLNDVLSADPLNDDARCCLDSARKLRGLTAEYV
jgi:predicted Zn-dependent protease